MSTFSRYPSASALPLVNRYIVILRPLQPYVDWVNGLPMSEPQEPGDKVFDLDEAQRYHRTSYLIPYAWEWQHAEAWFDENFDLFFQNELEGIEADRALWPDPRTLELFEAWFEAEVFDAPYDSTREPMFFRPKRKSKKRKRRKR